MSVHLQYVSDEQGNAVGVIVPIELWRKIEAEGLPLNKEDVELAATNWMQTVDLQAFTEAAGSWQDVDIASFMHAVREQRDQSYRPAVEL